MLSSQLTSSLHWCFQEILEQERQDFEEELENQNGRMKTLRTQIERSTHSEVEIYEEENKNLKQQLEDEKLRIGELEVQLSDAREKQNLSNHENTDAADSKQGTKVKNASDEVKELQKTVASLQAEREALNQKVWSLNLCHFFLFHRRVV